MNEVSDKTRLIDVHEVIYRTGMAKSTIWAKVAADEFVQPIKVKAGVTRWLESDIDQWIDDLVVRHRAQLAQARVRSTARESNKRLATNQAQHKGRHPSGLFCVRK